MYIELLLLFCQIVFRGWQKGPIDLFSLYFTTQIELIYFSLKSIIYNFLHTSHFNFFI